MSKQKQLAQGDKSSGKTSVDCWDDMACVNMSYLDMCKVFDEQHKDLKKSFKELRGQMEENEARYQAMIAEDAKIERKWAQLKEDIEEELIARKNAKRFMMSNVLAATVVAAAAASQEAAASSSSSSDGVQNQSNFRASKPGLGRRQGRE